MSFVFPSWSTAFSPAFHEDAKAMLEAALNKGNKPPVIQGRIEVVELSMGTQPPTLTLLEIGDLSLDRFRGILRLGYQGDAWLEVRCRVQANPLSHNPNLLPSSTLPLSTPLLASQPLLVPMTLRLSLLHLRAILILVVSASKGITLVFKNDPLQNVDVSSTFDSVEVIRGYLQQEIEGQLREMFREDLPGIIHRLSQRWFAGAGVGGKVETPYRDGDYAASSSTTGGTPGRPTTTEEDETEIEGNDLHAERDIFPPYVPSPSINLTPRRKALQKAMRSRRLSTAASDSPTSYTVFPDIEDYDPTYGLRPEGLPTHSGYEAFGRLWEKAREGETRGLGGLMDSSIGQGMDERDRGDVSDGDWDQEGEEDQDEFETGSFDMVQMEEALQVVPSGPRYATSSTDKNGRRKRAGTIDSSSSSRYGYGEEDQVEWETFPAVGGGVVSRPRVYHSQSRIRAPSDAGGGGGGGGGVMPSPGGTATAGSVTARASSIGGASSTVGSLRRLPSFTPLPTPGLGSFRTQTGLSGLAIGGGGGPGPSSLRRMATSRSDVFLSGYKSRSDSFTSSPPQMSSSSPSPLMKTPLLPYRQQHPLSRHQSTSGTGTGTGSSVVRTSGSSWGRDTYDSVSGGGGEPRMGSTTTPSSSQLSRSMSMDIKSPRKGSAGIGGGHHRTPSFGGTTAAGGTSFPPRGNVGPGGFTLPLNNSVSQLATLSHSNQTLSPYARGHEHIAVRSFPHLGRTGTGGVHSPYQSYSGAINSGSEFGSTGNGFGQSEDGGGGMRMKAVRKRIYRLGSGSGSAVGPGKNLPGSTTRDQSLSPDLGRTTTPPTDDDMMSRRLSSSSDSFGGNGGRLHQEQQHQQHPWQTPSSLVGTAQRIMRPSFGRGDSRTSYGFPPVSSIGRIPE